MRCLIIYLICFLLQLNLFSQSGGEDCSSATQILTIPFIGSGNTNSAIDDYFENCPDVGNVGGEFLQQVRKICSERALKHVH